MADLPPGRKHVAMIHLAIEADGAFRTYVQTAEASWSPALAKAVAESAEAAEQIWQKVRPKEEGGGRAA